MRAPSILALLLLAAMSAATPSGEAPLPPIVFVSRQPLEDGGVPGIGPRHRTASRGGRLMLRTADGKVRGLLRTGTLWDVSDPSVSWDGRTIVFAGTVARDSSWRIYRVGADGRRLRALTRGDRALDLTPLGSDAARFTRYDDFDPCWLPDGRVCFASTRFPQVSEIAGLAASNLYAVNADGTGLVRITSERNGAEEPTIDPRTGRIVYARWWLNRWLPSERESIGVTLERARAVPADTADFWQAVSVSPDGDGIRLAGGNPRVRAELAAYQPLVLRDGTLIGVRGELLARDRLSPGLTLESYPGGFAEPRHLAGALARPGTTACSPAALPDGRLLCSLDPEGRGDFGIWALRPSGRGLRKVIDLPGTLELDAALLRPRRRPPAIPTSLEPPAGELPITRPGQLGASGRTFRFDCLNVFANAPVDAPFPDAVPAVRGARIRFYAVLARPGNPSGDTLVLVRESEVKPEGGVHEHEMPADTPMFEQLVDGEGRVLRSSSGPAHVPGFNAGRFGSGTKCVGCHLGHSAMEVAPTYTQGQTFNCAPSAEVTASSVVDGTQGVRAAVDRRAKGSPRRVAWVAKSDSAEWIRLAWRWPIDVSGVVLYSISPSPTEGTDLKILQSEIVFYRDDREVRRMLLGRELSPSGTRLDCPSLRVDAVLVRPLRLTGRVMGRPAAALAEIETIGRLAPID